MPTLSIPGRWSLFFAPHASDQAWRFKEKVVAIIEGSIHGRPDVLTFSNARIDDCIGSAEEVDVAFSNAIEPENIFAFVEVRARSQKVGRPYIQQIIGKRQTLGIDSVTVVSTTGFSRDAIRLARHAGISIRVLRDASAAKIASWFAADGVGSEIGTYAIDFVKADYHPDGESLLVVPEDCSNVTLSSFVMRTENGFSAVSNEFVFQEAIVKDARWNELLDTIPKDGRLHPIQPIGLSRLVPALYLATEVGTDRVRLSRIDTIEFNFRAGWLKRFFRMTARYEYFDPLTSTEIGTAFVCKFANEYICLTRHSCNKGECKLGGAYFK